MRNRLPTSSQSGDKLVDQKLEINDKIIEVKLISASSNSNKSVKKQLSNDAVYQELAKSCKEDPEYIDDNGEGSEENCELETVNDVDESYDAQYENLNETYFSNNTESITLKVIDNQLSTYLYGRCVSAAHC